MNPENPILWDVLQLASNLRQERLFVNSEQVLLQELNEKVMTASSKLAEVAWITSQQRLNLNKLIVSRPDTTPAMCSKKANSLNSAKFVSAQNALGYQKCASYGEVLDSLRGSPELVARCLVAGDACLSEEMPTIVYSLVTGLYASCVLPADKNVVLQILGHLISLQLAQSETPRRLLRPGSCAFSCLYSAFHESLFSAKLYLTAALHSPIMQLLMMEEKYLDIDPEKVAIRLEERAKLLGSGSDVEEQHNLDVETHRASTVKVLASVAQAFISSLRDNLHCFPRSVCWLVNRIYLQLTKANSLPEKEIFSMCTDLVLTLFICPAIVKPEPYGITDVPISSVARFNLIQVAQIIQMLALRKFEPIDPKLNDLYSHFDKDSVSSIIDTMIDPNFIVDDPVVDVESGKFEHLTRTTALFTELELNTLVAFLRTVSNTNSGDAKLQKELPSLLNQLPSPVANGHPKPSFPSPEISTKKSKILKGSKYKHHNGSSAGLEVDEDEYGPTVLVIPFDINNDSSLGLDSEQKVLAMEKDEDGDRMDKGLKTEKSDRAEGQEKRTRFSLTHDDGSIGNTSDNLEVVSEAPSNHSVASSLELETEDQNDNLSDMISANVSGRGSPSISGRDTPSSQITEGDESAAGGSSVRQQLDFTPSRPVKIAPQPRFDLDEKFGKFEIKALMDGADETFSLVSDTWSTDVLASDSEILEQQMPLMLPPPLIPEPIAATIVPPQLDTTETASEAWSTDVMASDSERMTEVDTDDTASVARSDDTGRSEIESRGDPEPTEDVAGAGPLVPGVGSGAIACGGSPATVAPPLTPGPSVSSPARQVETINAVSTSNVTGRGGARSDYRRRTLEYLDSNRNIYSKLGYQEEGAGSVDKEGGKVVGAAISALSSSSAAIMTPIISSPSSAGHELDDDRTERDSTCAPMSCVSASSSSSGSSDVATNQTNDVPSASLLVPNGSVVMQQDIVGSSKPSSAPGAIPKSISFDKTAERGDKESLDEDGKHKKSFFRFKLPFKNRRGKSFRFDGFDGSASSTGDSSFPQAPARLRRGASADESSNRLTSTPSSSLATATSLSARLDTTEDILAKYRGQSASSSTGKPTTSLVSSGPPSESAGSSEKPPSDKGYDLFEDARKKLRLALSTSEVQQLPDALHLRETWNRKENDLVTFLRIQLAEAINLQDTCLTPQLYETLRCVKMLSDEECQKLFSALKEDYKSRKPYISYLLQCRQGLLSTLAHIDRLKERVKRDRAVVLEFLSSMCVRMFLERREQQLSKFAAEFQGLTLADEKSDLSETFLERFFVEMTKDPVWQSASEDQLEQARVSVERSLFSRVYLPAMYPNGDGDIARDQVLSDHISKLGKVISPDHKDLRIPQMFLCECPWLSAQAEMSQMAAYRSPRDKLHCVLRSITTIMNLLSLTCVPAADDLMPVLVYVIIMANPPSLLSTIEYVTSFYGNRLEGEEQYYWTQFCSAIEFIKTMDYLVNE